MDKKIVAVIGLIGGILAAVGVFGTWASGAISGWDLTKAIAEGGINAKLPYVALVGGILAIIGSILVLVKPGVVPKLLLAIGGMMALIGVAYGLDIADVGAGAGYGVYLVVIGGILAILTTLGLKGE